MAQVYLEQELWDERVEFAFGRLAAGDDFAASEAYGYYVSAAIDSNPLSLNVNTATFAIAPLSQWGVRLTVSPAKDSYLSFGAYAFNPELFGPGSDGLDFSLNLGEGVLGIAEAGLEDPLTRARVGSAWPSAVITIAATSISRRSEPGQERQLRLLSDSQADAIQGVRVIAAGPHCLDCLHIRAG